MTPSPAPSSGPRRRPHPLGRRRLALLWDAHSAVGLLLAPVLLIIFTTGVFLPWHEALRTWTEPAARRGAAAPGLDHVLDAVPREAYPWVEVHLPESAGGLGLVEYHHKDEEPVELWVDGSSGRSVAPRSGLVDQIYGLHFFHQLPGGSWIAGLLGLLAASAVLSGLGVHLRDLWRHLGRLRARPLRARRADGHTLLGTALALPLLVLALTGAMLCLAEPVAAAHVWKTFGGELQAAYRQLGYDWPLPVGTPVLPWEAPDIAATIAAAQAELPGLMPHWIGIRTVGAPDAAVLVYGLQPGIIELGAQVDLAVADHALLRVVEARTDLPAAAISRWSIAAHFANWGPGALGGAVVRWLYVALALGCVGLGGLGVALWSVRPPPGRLGTVLPRLAAWSTAGLAAAIAAGLATSQLAPLVGLDHPSLDVAVLYGTWLATGLLLWRGGPRRVLPGLLAATAGALGLAALLSALVVETAAWPLRHSRPVLLGVDLGLGLGALLALGLAWALRRREVA